MNLVKAEGGHPQNSTPSARGVSLTRPERAFLDRLTDPLADFDPSDPAVLALGRAALLRPEDVAFIHEWVVNQGVHWLTCEETGLNQMEGAKVFRNPAVRRIINAAADLGFCLATSALREEMEDYFTQRVRNTFLPAAVRDAAAVQLCKLKGYYPDSSGKSGAQANIQINFVNPYAAKEVVNE